MRLEYRLALHDVVLFQIYEHERGAASGARRRMATFGVALLIFALVGLLALIVRNWTIAAAGGVVAVTYYFLLPRLLRVYVQRTAVRLYTQGPGRALLGERALQITPDGLRAESPEGSSTTPWPEVARVVQLARYAFIYLGDGAAHVVPQDTIVRGDYDAFVREVRARAGTAGGRGSAR